jgi:carboxyl-terminal processing protease
VATIVDVRKDSPAWKANLRPGAQIISINGVDVATAIAKRVGTCLRKRDSAVDDWALQTLLAGRHSEPVRKLEIKNGNVQTTVSLALAHRNFSSLLESRTLGNDNEIGYIRPNNSLGDTDLIAAFDKALDSLKLTKGLVLDLRETPSGGNSLVARAIMGRFVSRECFYQKHQVPAEEQQFGVRRSWVEIVSPRGPFTYKHPVVVLVNHWTGSMGEGIAIGMDAIKRGHVVGVEMARLLGATEGITLPHTRISVHFPTEKLFHPNGLPREKFVPRNYVDLIKTGAQLGEDPILTTGLKILQTRLRAGREKEK